MADDLFPPAPAPGSNAIGSFAIGVSPIGTIAPFQWQRTVISQYANSPRILALLEDFNAYIDQTENLDAFYDKMFNIQTAEGYGLDVWGRIVGVNRVLQVASGRYLGFEEAGSADVDPFDQSPFYAGVTLTSNYALSDDAYRTLILAKALANICEGSIPAINQLLLYLFPGRGNCYVTDGPGNDARFLGFAESGTINSEAFGQAPFFNGQGLSRMAMTYTFNFVLTPVEVAIVEQSGVLPTPTGVSASIVIAP